MVEKSFSNKLISRWFLTRQKGLFGLSLVWSLVGLSLSLVVLLITLGIVSGFENSLSMVVSRAQGTLFHQFPSWKSLDEISQFAQNIPQKELIQRIEPYWTSQGLLVGQDAGRGVLIEGRYSGGQDSPELDGLSISIGSALADYLGVGVGSRLKVLLPGVLKGAVEVSVKDIIHLGMYDIESRLAILDATGLARYLKNTDPDTFAKRPGDAHGVRIYLPESLSKPSRYSELTSWVDDYRHYIEDFHAETMGGGRVLSYKDSRSTLFRGIGYNKIELALILGILVVVASLNVGATFVVLFMEREREFAILQAMGWSPSALRLWILKIALVIGLGVSFAASCVAVVFGKLLIKTGWIELPASIYNINNLPLTFELKEIIIVSMGGVASCLFIAFVMGFKLTKTKITEVLSFRRM